MLLGILFKDFFALRMDRTGTVILKNDGVKDFFFSEIKCLDFAAVAVVNICRSIPEGRTSSQTLNQPRSAAPIVTIRLRLTLIPAAFANPLTAPESPLE